MLSPQLKNRKTLVVAVQDLTPLEDKERLRAEFLGLVSEALGVPLTTIKGSVASLQDTTNFQDTTESLQLLRTSIIKPT